MDKATRKKDFSLLNSIGTTVLAFFLTIPFHEFIHFLTYYVYGDKAICYSAGAVASAGIDISNFSDFDKLIYSGGNASVVNVLIGILLLVVILKVKKIKPILRMFLIQLMGAQLTTGVGYFMIGGLFSFGDWGNVFNAIGPDSGLAVALHIILSVLGCGGIVALFFILNHLSYDFIKDPADKKERMSVAFKMYMPMFFIGILLGTITTFLSPAVASGDLDLVASLLLNFMWIPFFWGFMFTWRMVKPPKKSRFLATLPEKSNYLLYPVALVLVLIDVFVFGPGIYL